MQKSQSRYHASIQPCRCTQAETGRAVAELEGPAVGKHEASWTTFDFKDVHGLEIDDVGLLRLQATSALKGTAFQAQTLPSVTYDGNSIWTKSPLCRFGHASDHI